MHRQAVGEASYETNRKNGVFQILATSGYNWDNVALRITIHINYGVILKPVVYVIRKERLNHSVRKYLYLI